VEWEKKKKSPKLNIAPGSKGANMEGRGTGVVVLTSDTGDKEGEEKGKNWILFVCAIKRKEKKKKKKKFGTLPLLGITEEKRGGEGKKKQSVVDLFATFREGKGRKYR